MRCGTHEYAACNMPNIENDIEHLSFVKLKQDNYIESGKEYYELVRA